MRGGKQTRSSCKSLLLQPIRDTSCSLANNLNYHDCGRRNSEVEMTLKFNPGVARNHHELWKIDCIVNFRSDKKRKTFQPPPRPSWGLRTYVIGHFVALNSGKPTPPPHKPPATSPSRTSSVSQMRKFSWSALGYEIR